MPCSTHFRRIGFFITSLFCVLATSATAQQQYPTQSAAPRGAPTQPAVAPQAPLQQSQSQQPPAAQEGTAPQIQPQPPQAPEGFQLNKLQEAFLIQVLDNWQLQSGKINTFSCPFERLDYNRAFGPAANIPLSVDTGELSYSKPDKGSFQISEIKKWTVPQVPAGQQPPAQVQGEFVVQKDAIGEHWVCDGKSVFEYRHDQKQLVERPIPPELQGQAIMDGPLPFLFGAETKKLMARYWLRVLRDDPNEIWLEALPKFQADAANFTQVRVILDRGKMLPRAMEVNLPDKSRHVYKFDLAKASINSPLARLGALFSRPRTPFGYTRVVENIPPQQAAQPGPAPR